MSSYREPSERDGDRIVYFDYAKSLESKRRPIPWRLVARVFLRSIVSLAVATSFIYALTGKLHTGIFLYAVSAVVVSIGLIPVLRANRQLSADNIVEARRRQ